MASRCPTSTYHSFGVLRGYRWIIGERGYANIVKTPCPPQSLGKHPDGRGEPEGDVVYGMLYTLEEADERKLDRSEGVPYAYLKRKLDVELLSKEGGGLVPGEVVEALVYVDEMRLGEGVCKEEYVARMNRGIEDAMGKGMGREYVDGVLRAFVREEDVGEGVLSDPFHPEKMEKEGGYDEEE